MTALLSLAKVWVRLGETPILRDVDLALEAGRITALVGPNGAGKSTALRVAARLLQPSAGTVTLMGRPVSAWSAREFAREVAVVPQEPITPGLFRVRDYVALGRTPYLGWLSGESAADWRVVDESIAEASLSDLTHRRLATLSGGERQRAVFARALAQRARVLLLDEPTANLDLRFQRESLVLLRRLARETGVAALVVVHDLSLAGQFGDTVVLLDAGRVAATGSPREVLQEERLGQVYQTPVRVLRHPDDAAPIVVHAGLGDGAR